MFEFESQDNLIRLTVETATDGAGGPALRVRRWCRAAFGDEWDEDGGDLTLWPDDPVREMAELLVAAWSAQARLQGCIRT